MTILHKRYGLILLGILAFSLAAMPVAACETPAPTLTPVPTVTPGPMPAPGWYDCTWQYRKSISIDRTKVAGDQAEFPVLVSLTGDAGLRDYAQAGGNDILFTASDGTTKLPHEIESYSGGTLVAWVKVPRLTKSADTVLYMYYGNPSSPNMQDRTGVWTNGYVGVWHLGEAGDNVGYDYRDSTSYANHGQGGAGTAGRQPARTISGQIGAAQDFNRASTQFISIPNSISLQLTTGYTLEAWGKSDAFLAGWQYPNLVARQYGSGWGDSYTLSFGNGGASTAPFYSWYNGGSLNTGTTTYRTGTWYHAAAVIGNTASYLYINGTQVASRGGITTSTDTNPTLIGAQENDASSTPTMDSLWDGIIDEVRISNLARPASWIQTEYNNQNNPSIFYRVGGVEENPCKAFSCPAETYPLVTADGKTAGCVAITNEWKVSDDTGILSDTLYVTFTAADAIRFTEADVAVSLTSTPVKPQFRQTFDPDSRVTSHTFAIVLPSNFDDVSYLFVSAFGTVQGMQGGDASGGREVSARDNPIEYILQAY